jgi:hypothetical protein
MTMHCYDPSEVEYDDAGFEKPMPTEKCLNHPSPECSGPTRTRTSRSGLTHSLKCDGCQSALDVRLDEINERYPDSANPPSWFDPTYAGESWDGDY